MVYAANVEIHHSSEIFVEEMVSRKGLVCIISQGLSLRPEKGTENFLSLALASFCIEYSLQPFLLDVNLVV